MHTASRNDAVPVLGEYRVFPPRIAAHPASTIAAGVSKSGSPAARPITGKPLSFIERARSVSAIVLDSRRDATRGLSDWSTEATAAPRLIDARAVTGARRRGRARRSAARGKSADDASVGDVIVATVRDARRGLGPKRDARDGCAPTGYRNAKPRVSRADRENTQIL